MTALLVVVCLAAGTIAGWLAGQWHAARNLPRTLSKLDSGQVRALGRLVDAHRPLRQTDEP